MGGVSYWVYRLSISVSLGFRKLFLVGIFLCIEWGVSVAEVFFAVFLSCIQHKRAFIFSSVPESI